MKVTPIASGTGEPGLMSGNVEIGQSASQSRKDEAVRAFKGESPISLTEKEDPQVTRIKKRRMVMNTKATPLSMPPLESQVTDEVPHGTTQPATIQPNETLSADAEKPLSPQFAALARQRRQLQQREQALLAKERALAEKEQTGQGSQTLDLERIKADPLGVLRQAGVSYDDLTQAILNNPQASTIDTESLKQELLSQIKSELSKGFETRDQQTEQEVLTQMRRDAESLVNSSDEFELVRATRSIPDAIELVHRTYKKTGELLDLEEALKLIEEDLTEQLTPIAQSKKIQTRLKPAMAQPQQMRTLTNRDSIQAPISRKERALAAFYGTLKK